MKRYASVKHATLCAIGFALLTLAGCKSEHGEPISEQSNAPPAARTALVEAGSDIMPLLAQSGKPWNTPPILDRSNYTQSVRLSRRMVVFRDASVTIDRSDDGSVYMVVLQSGIAERCGAPEVLGRAYATLANPLRLPTLDNVDIERLRRAWASKDESEDAAADGVVVRAIGGCLPKLLLKAEARS